MTYSLVAVLPHCFSCQHFFPARPQLRRALKIKATERGEGEGIAKRIVFFIFLPKRRKVEEMVIYQKIQQRQ